MNKSNQPFDGSAKVASGMVSLGFLILVFILLMGYRYFEIQTLFVKYLPIADESNRIIASVLIAIVAVFATMLFMVHANSLAPIPYTKASNNSKQFPLIKGGQGDVSTCHPVEGYIHWSKFILVLISFAINYFFWEVWNTDLPTTVKIPPDKATQFKWFVCCLNAAFDYGFAHLFDVLRKKVIINQDIIKLDQTKIKLNQEVNEKQSIVIKLESREKEIKELISKSTCGECGFVSTTPKGLNGHKCKTIKQ